MSKKNQKSRFIFPITLILIQMCFLYFVKYSNQALSIENFSIFKTGNLINLVLYALVTTGLLILFVKKNQLLNKKILVTYLSISWIMLIAAFGSTKINFLAESDYFFNQPADKALTGILFLFFLVILISFCIHIWFLLISEQKVKIGRVLSVTLLLFLIFFIIILIYIDNASYTSGRWSITKNKNNVVVVLGAAVWTGNIPSPTLSSRVDKALQLYNDGFAGRIVLTGGKAPGELPESEVAFEYARASGADTSVFIIEKQTSSTSDQLKWVKDNLTNNYDKSEIILVSDAYHLPRVIEISNFFNLNIKVAESFHKLNFRDLIYNKIRECIALFNFWNFAL